MKVYITKYALTQGIFEAKVKDHGDGMVEDIRVKILPTYYHGDEWHCTLDEARKKAEAMRMARIALLEKSLKKLRSMTF